METIAVPQKVEARCSHCSWRYHGDCLHPKGKLGSCPLKPSRRAGKADDRPKTDDAAPAATPVLEPAAAGSTQSR